MLLASSLESQPSGETPHLSNPSSCLKVDTDTVTSYPKCQVGYNFQWPNWLISHSVVLQASMLLVALVLLLTTGITFIQVWLTLGAYSHVSQQKSPSYIFGLCLFCCCCCIFFKLIIYWPSHSSKLFSQSLVHHYCFYYYYYCFRIIIVLLFFYFNYTSLVEIQWLKEKTGK